MSLFAFVFIWLTTLSVFLYRFLRHYQKLTKGATKKDFKTVFDGLLKNAEVESKKVSGLIKQIKALERENFYHIQKIGLVRFNPFAETGGDQSFSLAVLDNHDSGFVISSLHSRDTTRLYAKPVKKGKAVNQYELSKEEKQAIKSARKVK